MAVAFKGSKSAGIGLEGVKLAIESCRHRLGEFLTNVRPQVVKMAFEQLRLHRDRLQSRANRPSLQFVDEMR
jgi:hypothetical protein